MKLVVDDYSDYSWSFCFLMNKSDSKAKVINLLTDLKIADIHDKFICCDDTEENKSIREDPRVTSFGLTFELSGSRNPQTNDKVERKFPTF